MFVYMPLLSLIVGFVVGCVIWVVLGFIDDVQC